MSLFWGVAATALGVALTRMLPWISVLSFNKGRIRRVFREEML
jgi:hypothetical protein